MICDFCAFGCDLKPGAVGRCKVRFNDGGVIRYLYPQKVFGPRVEAVEKKPLYHFYPGSETFSLAWFGCNFRCSFCQNYHLMDTDYAPERSAGLDEPDGKADTGALFESWHEAGKPPLAVTYAEPAVWQDMWLELAAKVQGQGGKTIVVSNGFYSPASLDSMMKVSHAFNIDLKGGPDFYREFCSGRQAPVLDSIRRLSASEGHVLEVTTLFIEGEHSRDEIFNLADELHKLEVRVWHLSLFYPAYKMKDRRRSSEEQLVELISELEGSGAVDHIYLGNGSSAVHSDTHCTDCGQLLIRRSRAENPEVFLLDGRCPGCGKVPYGSF